jgi:hypothetical protein
VRGRLWLASVLALASCADPPEVRRAHGEILAARDAIRGGMRIGELCAAIEQLKLKHVSLRGQEGPQVAFDETVPQGGREWVLWVVFRDVRVASVRIRTRRSVLDQPKEAPPDLIWEPEDSDSYWMRE